MSGGPQLQFRRDRMLRMAQAAARTAKFDALGPNEIRRARHLAHEGATPLEIAAALNWCVGEGAARSWLKKLNIPINRAKYHAAHKGEGTSSRPCGFERYRPRVLS